MNSIVKLVKSARDKVNYWTENRYEYVIDRENKVAYLVNSKAACSSIKASMYKKDFCDDYSVHDEYSKRLFTGKPFSDESFFKFTYVRNPYSKLVSCYTSKYKFDLRCLDPSQLEFEGYLHGIMRRDMGFNIFLFWVFIIPDITANKHFRNQYKLTHRKGCETVNFIGRIEEMESYDDIAKKYGYAPLKMYNHNEYGPWIDYYSVLTTLMVYLKYRKDIKYFGYEEVFRKVLRYTVKNKRFLRGGKYVRTK